MTTPMLNLKFSAADLILATRFANTVQLELPTQPRLSTIEQEDDSIEVSHFVLTKVEDVRVYSSARGEVRTPVVSIVVTTEQRSYSHSEGESSDEVELSRHTSLTDALKACALHVREWEVSNIMEGVLGSIETEAAMNFAQWRDDGLWVDAIAINLNAYGKPSEDIAAEIAIKRATESVGKERVEPSIIGLWLNRLTDAGAKFDPGIAAENAQRMLELDAQSGIVELTLSQLIADAVSGNLQGFVQLFNQGVPGMSREDFAAHFAVELAISEVGLEQTDRARIEEGLDRLTKAGANFDLDAATGIAEAVLDFQLNLSNIEVPRG